MLMGTAVGIALLALVGWGYRAVRRAPEEKRLPLHHVAVGWSHETWLFDARWRDADGEHTRGLCLRRDIDRRMEIAT